MSFLWAMTHIDTSVRIISIQQVESYLYRFVIKSSYLFTKVKSHTKKGHGISMNTPKKCVLGWEIL